MEGGGESYLSAINIVKFLQIINDAAVDVNCISTYLAQSVATSLRESRIKRAKLILVACGNPKLAARIKRCEAPDLSWLKKFSEANGISVTNPQYLEEARRMFCDEKAISAFFEKHSTNLERDPRLIWNMDETMVSSNKKFKVLIRKGHLPITMSPGKLPHVTACISINGDGGKLKPLVILPNKATLKGLEDFTNYFYFASSNSGWMNKDIFLMFSLIFVSEMQHYRLLLPSAIRNAPILLLVDGHKSRINYAAAAILRIFNIDLIVFPGHCSHVIQPFDVAVASPLKSAFKEAMLKYNMTIEPCDILKKKCTRDVRKMVLSCLLTAIDQSCTHSNIKSAFRKSGIIPISKEVALSSDFTMVDTIYKEIKDNMINNMYLNKDTDSLHQLFHLEKKRDIEAGDIVNIDKVISIIRYFHSSSALVAKLLTPIPDILIDEKDNIRRYTIDSFFE